MSLEFDERDRASVLRDLVSADAEVRRLAVERVSALSVDEAVERLVERLGDPDWRVRKAVVERLIAVPETQRAADALIGALADGDNPGRRNAAVEALVRHDADGARTGAVAGEGAHFGDRPKVRGAHFEAALTLSSPSVGVEQLARFKTWRAP